MKQQFDRIKSDDRRERALALKETLQKLVELSDVDPLMWLMCSTLMQEVEALNNRIDTLESVLWPTQR